MTGPAHRHVRFNHHRDRWDNITGVAHRAASSRDRDDAERNGVERGHRWSLQAVTLCVHLDARDAEQLPPTWAQMPCIDEHVASLRRLGARPRSLEPCATGTPLPGGPMLDTLIGVSDALHFTIRYTPIEDGWVMAQVEEVPSAVTQGRTRAEARENVLDALQLALSAEAPNGDPDREALTVSLAP